MKILSKGILILVEKKMSKIKICYISSLYPPFVIGGAETKNISWNMENMGCYMELEIKTNLLNVFCLC